MSLGWKMYGGCKKNFFSSMPMKTGLLCERFNGLFKNAATFIY